MKDLVLDAIEKIEHLYQKSGAIAGLATGFQELDRLTSGLQAPDLIVFGSRPGMGKTALSMNIEKFSGFRKEKGSHGGHGGSKRR